MISSLEQFFWLNPPLQLDWLENTKGTVWHRFSSILFRKKEVFHWNFLKFSIFLEYKNIGRKECSCFVFHSMLPIFSKTSTKFFFLNRSFGIFQKYGNFCYGIYDISSNTNLFFLKRVGGLYWSNYCIIIIIYYIFFWQNICIAFWKFL